jgi:hypothetical protein
MPDAQGFAAVVVPGDGPKKQAVVIAYRGTDSRRDMLIDATAQQTAAKEYGVGADVRVHRGFFLQAEALWERIEREVWSMVLTPAGKEAPCAKNPSTTASDPDKFDELFHPVFFTGHSLGGAVATIAGSRVASPKSDAEREYLDARARCPTPTAESRVPDRRHRHLRAAARGEPRVRRHAPSTPSTEHPRRSR